MLGAIHSRRMLCGGHVDHPGSQPASRIGVTEWRHRCARASRAVKRCAGAPGVVPRCLLARPWDRARLRRSRWRDRACRRASAQGVEGHRARARRRSRHENPHSRPSPKNTHAPRRIMWSLPHGVCVVGSRPPVLTRAREGVSWTHDTSPWALASGAEPIPMDRLSSLPLMTLAVLSRRLWAPDRISRVGFLADAASDACGLTTLGCRGVPSRWRIMW